MNSAFLIFTSLLYTLRVARVYHYSQLARMKKCILKCVQWMNQKRQETMTNRVKDKTILDVKDTQRSRDFISGQLQEGKSFALIRTQHKPSIFGISIFTMSGLVGSLYQNYMTNKILNFRLIITVNKSVRRKTSLLLDN